MAKAKELIGEAEVGTTLDLVEDFLKKEPKYGKLHREALQISALFNKTKRDEAKGIISFDNANLTFNQVNDRLLNLLEYIESDHLSPEGLTAPPGGMQGMFKAYKWQIIMGLPLIVVVLVGWFLWQNSGKTPADPKDGVQVNGVGACPSFQPPSELNIMLLPFYLLGYSGANPVGLLVERIEDFCNKYRLQTTVKIHENIDIKGLLDFDDAMAVGKSCNAQLVIWGRLETAGGNTIVKTRFRYLGEKENDIQFKQLRWGEKQVDTLKTLSAIATQRDVTGDLEQVILLALGAAATEMGNTQTAIAALNDIKSRDSSTVLLKNLLLADNYLVTKEGEKALAAYDSLLEVHPKYWLALNNRGMLRMNQGDLLGAIEDFSVALEGKKDNPDLLLARAKAYQNSDQLAKAKKDYEKVIEVQPEKKPMVEKPLEQTKQELEKQEAVIQQNKITSQRPSTSTKDVDKKTAQKTADAFLKTGKDVEAMKVVENGLKMAPKDAWFIASQIELLLRQGKKEEAIKTYREALQSGVKKEDLTKAKPYLKNTLDKLTPVRQQMLLKKQ